MQTARPLPERPFDQLLRQAARARLDGFVVLRDRDDVRHGVWIESGYVVGVHVAGHYDPLLALLQQKGTLSASLQRRCLRALSGSEERSGSLACALAGISQAEVRATLSKQLVDRFALLYELAATRGHEARFEPCAVPQRERALCMPLGSLLRRAAIERGSGSAQPRSGAEARRALRSLARQLHPDLHPELEGAQRERLARELARATAAYHGFC